jgi:hypothetical protein
MFHNHFLPDPDTSLGPRATRRTSATPMPAREEKIKTSALREMRCVMHDA